MPDIVQIAPKNLDPKKPAPVGKASRLAMPSGIPARQGPAMALAFAMTTPAAAHTSEPILPIERLVAVIIRTSRRLGRRPTRLLPLIAGELDRYCLRGDPTALMLRKWIDRDTAFDRRAAAMPVRIVSVQHGREG